MNGRIRSTVRWRAQVVGVVALVLGLGRATLVQADPLLLTIPYNTQGFISTPSADGPSAVNFQGLSNASLSGDTSSISLGQFLVTPPATGVTTYQNTPFYVTFDIPGLDKTVYDPDTPGVPYTDLKITQYVADFGLEGHLNGTVSSDGQSNLIATFDRFQFAGGLAFPTDQRVIVNSLPFSLTQLALPAPLALTSASTPLAIQAIPEPTSAAVFLAAIAGLALYRRSRSPR